MLTRPTIYLADAQSLFCELVANSLGDPFEIVGIGTDGQRTVHEVTRLKPDVVILDVFMPLLNGLDVATRIRESTPSTRIIFLTMRYDPGVARRAMAIGVLGFLLKSSAASELPAAIWAVMRGNRHVTPAIVDLFEEQACEVGCASAMTTREREVVQLLAEGKAMKQAADVLHVSTRTIAFHKYSVMKKLGLRSSAELVRVAVSQGLVAEAPEAPALHLVPAAMTEPVVELQSRTA